MTVQKLISELQKFPRDKEVYIDDSALLYIELNHIYLYKPVYCFEPKLEADEPIVVISSK